MAPGAAIWGVGDGEKKIICIFVNEEKRSRKAAPGRAGRGGAHLSRLGFAVAFLHGLWFAQCLRAGLDKAQKCRFPSKSVFCSRLRGPPFPLGLGKKKYVKKNQR